MTVGDGVEQYLDELFDRVAGQGAAGRRMLAETEDHLRSAVEEGIDHGLSREAAERAAVARFGEPGRVAALVDEVHSRAGLVRAGLTAARVGGLALVMLGGIYLLTALVLHLWVAGSQWMLCDSVNSRALAACGGSTRITVQTAATGGLFLFLGGMVLGLVRLAPRSGSRTRQAALAAAFSALVGVVVFVDLPIVVGVVFHEEGLWRRAAAVTTALALVNLAVTAGRALAVRRRTRPVEAAA